MAEQRLLQAGAFCWKKMLYSELIKIKPEKALQREEGNRTMGRNVYGMKRGYRRLGNITEALEKCEETRGMCRSSKEGPEKGVDGRAQRL